MNFQSDKPLYIQVAEMIEKEILKGNIRVDEQVPSTTDFTRIYQINPATSMKGLNLLVEEGILYKRRGLGFFLGPRGKELILEKKREEFYQDLLPKFIEAMDLLDLDREDLIKKLREGGKDDRD